MIEAKIIFFLLLIAFGLSISKLKYSNQLRITEKLILIIFFFSISIFILNPTLLDAIASLLKIERGRDFLFYILIPSSIWLGIRNHLRLNYLSSKLSKISSELALKNPYKF